MMIDFHFQILDDTSVRPLRHSFTLWSRTWIAIKTLDTHLLVLFFRLSMSSLRKRKPSWWVVWVGGGATAGLLWAGADLDRRVVVTSPPSLGRGRRRGLGLSRARGRSRREDFSGRPLGRRGTSPRAWRCREVVQLVTNSLSHSRHRQYTIDTGHSQKTVNTIMNTVDEHSDHVLI